MRRMGITEKAKDIADKGFEKAGEYSGKASGKAAELAEKAGGKATELSGTARERAPEYIDRAAELAEKVVEAAAAGADKVTGGRYHEQISSAAGKIEQSLDRARHSTHGATSASAGPDIKPATDVSGQAGAPITPSSTNPDAEKS
jgi:hypothetical protein